MHDDAEQALDANRQCARSRQLPASKLHMHHSCCLSQGPHSDFVENLTPEILADAAHKCARGVKWKASVTQWLFNLKLNCAKLCNQIKTKKYKLQRYVIFRLFDKKPRTIHSTKFVDRVVQRAMCDSGLLDKLLRPLIYENGACIEGKGFTFAFRLVEKHLKKFFFKHNRSNVGWYVKADVSKFFDSTPHSVLKAKVSKTFTDPYMKERICEIIDSFGNAGKNPYNDAFGVRGVGLGSQISQLLQLLVLNDLDHVIKQKHRIKFYVRYMDDMLLLVDTKDQATCMLNVIGNELSKIGLSLNCKSTIGRIQDGFTFLNVRFMLTQRGKVKKKLGKKTIRRELKRLKTLASKLHNKNINMKTFMQHLNSWFGSNMCKMSRGQIKMMRQYVAQLLRSPRSLKSKQQIKDH